MAQTPKPLTILRTAAGTPACVSQIGKLREAGVRVVAADCDPLSVGFAFADVAACVPRVNCPGYIDGMLALCARESVDWLLPALDEELLILAMARSRFDAIGTRLLLPEAETVRVVTDKLATYRFFRSHGIPTPATVDLCALDDSGSVGAYPLIIKPRRGRGSHGIHIVHSYSEAAAIRVAGTDCIAQALVIGAEFTVDVLANFDSEPAVICPRRRIATDSGISVKSQIVRNEEMERYVAIITRKLKLIGLVNIQCFVTSLNEVLFTEVNARVAGTSILSAASGAPLFSGLAALLRGEPLPQDQELQQDLIMLRYWSEVYVTPSQAAGWKQ